MRKNTAQTAFYSRKNRLRPPRGLSGRIRRAAESVSRPPREELSPAASLIRDHARFLLDEADGLKRALRRAPRLPGDGKTPRVLKISREILRREPDELDPAFIIRAVREEAGKEEITEEEIFFLPRALACACFERLDQILARCGEEADRKRRADAWARAFSFVRQDRLPKDPLTAWEVLSLLSDREDSAALRRADEALAIQNRRSEEIARNARETLSREGWTAGWIIAGLRALPRLPFDRIGERLSPAAAVLREEAIYRKMDDESRNAYRQSVGLIARRLSVRESDVARAALSLSQGKQGKEGQAGYYLLEKPERIGEALGRKRRAFFAPRHRQGLFLTPLYGGAALSLAGAALLGAPWYAWAGAALCASEIIRQAYYAFLRRCFPPRIAPRLRMTRLTEKTRTLVVLPVLLASRKQAVRMTKRLAVLRAAHPDPFIEFMLLADYADSEQETLPEDEEILSAVRWGVDALNERDGGGFYYLQRTRKWDMGQRRYTGRERKRGALEALNRLITEGRCADRFEYMTGDKAFFQNRFAYVVTLDADTFPPPGSVNRLVGAMEHPLQKGRAAVIQPRMETAADSVRTRIQKLLGGRGGADPYHLSVQDVYQDVFGTGSFVGKGIYAPALWMKRLEGRLPSGRLLSHDLIEGEWAGGALAEDIVFYDGHPASLAGWQKRLHRWTRGDWQLLPFLSDRRLSLLSRHKIWDNLRRSLLPAGQMTLLLLGAGLNMPFLFLLGMPWPLRGMGRRSVILPGKALTCLDAAVRALYRQFVSRRNLLSWVTAAQAEEGSVLPFSCVLAQLAAGAVLTGVSLLPGGWLPGAFLGLGWVVSPLLIRWADGAADRPRPMTDAQEKAVRALARATWRFFEDTVTERTLFLPPDNEQTDPEKGIAPRTSPTNIGLYLLSCCAARELRFLSAADWASRLSRALDAMEKMDTWKGHFFNWYSLKDGSPLAPSFVSTVDSGNLAACLLCCAQTLRKSLPEIPEIYHHLPARLDQLAYGMDFSALYDRKTHLFYVGWETDQNKPAAAHYDSLAGEARLTSFLAIMTGQAERKHWRSLNRAVVRAGGGRALLSWGGTMFEYLMPQLLLPLTPGTLLGEGILSAVRAQMTADPSRPFGVSESGYYAFDPEMNYQYRAFGLPLLARTRETAGQVIAPYASMLALPFFPRAAADNLIRMQRLGWQDAHGLFEAADYTPQRLGGSPRLVKSHMAHHQGMILCAACNALTGNSLVRSFMALPKARAFAYLLLERPAKAAPRRRDLPLPREEKQDGASFSHRARLGLPVDAQALSGGGTLWVLTARGQGFLSHGDMLATRFDPAAGAQTGMQIYLRDAKTGAFIRPAAEGTARFENGGARFGLEWRGVRCTLDCCVDPLLGMAVASLKAENPGGENREMEVISFLEIAQGKRADDEAHPNFRDLSVRVLPWGENGLISQRLPREQGEETPLIGHAALGDCFALRRQGDRALFLGREGTYREPEQAKRESESCVFRVGDVTAPCLSLRAKLLLPAQKAARVFFVTLFGRNQEALDRQKPGAARARQAFALARTQADMTARFFKLDQNALSLYQEMLGALIFLDQPHRSVFPPASRGVLWQAGISGDLPLLLVSLPDGPDVPLIRHAFRAHAWMRSQGIRFDLAFLLPREDDYFRPCRDRVLSLQEESTDRGCQSGPGGVFLLENADARALESLSAMTLRGGQSLRAQLAALRLPVREEKEGAYAEPLPAAPANLTDFNGFGGFAGEDGYCVLSPAPVPWHMLLVGPSFGTLVCETGILQSYAGNSRLGRITRRNPDVKRGLPSEEIYLIDGENAYPLLRCAAVYEPGAAVYQTIAGEIRAEVSVFAHREKAMGIRAVTLRGEKEREIRLVWLSRFAMGENERFTRCWAENSFVFARNGEAEGVAWAALENGTALESCAALAFGMRGERLPAALVSLRQSPGSVGVLEKKVTLRPREQARLILALGYAENETEARRDYVFLLSQGASQALRDTRAFWAKRLSRLTLFSQDSLFEKMMNTWLPYQVTTSRLISRMGPYQPGGAWGFRDQLQDCLALLWTEPEEVRFHLIRCAAHQFPEGDVQHWWHEPRRGVRTRISDDRLFLPYVTALYVQTTQDESVLEERIPYLDAPPLKAEEKDRYDEPMETAWTETLLKHGMRALDSVCLGAHDLPLMGGGDWNDGMNRLGGETGESVWLGFFFAMVLKEFAPLCPPDRREKYLQLRRRVLDGAENAWTGSWYLRAWDKEGRPIAGPETAVPRIDLISQCFSVLAGAPRNHARTAMIHAAELLYDREAGMVKLLDPPFSPEENAGYIGGYLPGVRENGGQYTHAVPWMIMALCRLGEHRLAWEIARAILPLSHSDTKEKALIYQAEPYVLCGDVYAGENRGRGGWSWYTGSAAWLYRAVLTDLLGFEKKGGKARLVPFGDEDTEEFTLVYRFGASVYHFTAAHDTLFPTLDGARLEDGWAPLHSDGRTHEARFPFRRV